MRSQTQLNERKPDYFAYIELFELRNQISMEERKKLEELCTFLVFQKTFLLKDQFFLICESLIKQNIVNLSQNLKSLLYKFKRYQLEKKIKKKLVKIFRNLFTDLEFQEENHQSKIFSLFERTSSKILTLGEFGIGVIGASIYLSALECSITISQSHIASCLGLSKQSFHRSLTRIRRLQKLS